MDDTNHSDDWPDDRVKEETDVPESGTDNDRLQGVLVEPLCVLKTDSYNSQNSKISKKSSKKPAPKKFTDSSSDEDYKPPADEIIPSDCDDVPLVNRIEGTKKSKAKQKSPKIKKPPKTPKVKKDPSAPKVKKEKKERKPREKKEIKTEQCEVCGFISRSLKSHMLTHTQEKNFECDFCGKKFSLRASLKNHLFAHINIR